MPSGTVVKWDRAKGWGFIAPDDHGSDVFLHVGDLVPSDGRCTIMTGLRVSYELGANARGPKAAQVRMLNGEPPARPPGAMTAAEFRAEVEVVASRLVDEIVVRAVELGWAL